MIVETGEGVPFANSYASLATADVFHADRGNEAWEIATSAAKTAALIRATDYIEATYRPEGYRLSALQGLQWPLLGDLWLNPAVVAATTMLALYALEGPIQGPSERGIKSSKKSLDGVGSFETVFDDADSDPFPAITAMLSHTASVRGSATVYVGRLTR